MNSKPVVEGQGMTERVEYHYLKPKPGSNYRQWFLKGRRIRAAVVYEAIHGAERTSLAFRRAPSTPTGRDRSLGIGWC